MFLKCGIKKEEKKTNLKTFVDMLAEDLKKCVSDNRTTNSNQEMLAHLKVERKVSGSNKDMLFITDINAKLYDNAI